jgi:Ser/Thr protein kinase RdoA (MazF antagonist)
VQRGVLVEAIQHALNAWDFGGQPLWKASIDGLINQTYFIKVDHTPVAVLQRLNTDIFEPTLHYDIEAVTQHLKQRGVLTPTLIPTRTGHLWHEDEEGGIWRCQTIVGDRTIHYLTHPTEGLSAGRLVGGFHSALADFTHHFHHQRKGVHDTRAHFAHLKNALTAHRGHRFYSPAARLAEAIHEAFDPSWLEWDLPQRIIHGDLKISNIRYQNGVAVALIDLDTLTVGTLDEELGDAFRSWCNLRPEDAHTARFDLVFFETALRGYARGCAASAPPTQNEWASIIPGIQRICWELTARFTADTLVESYFGWNPRFGSRGAHNLLRAQNQCRLVQSFTAHIRQAEDIVKDIGRQIVLRPDVRVIKGPS